MHTGRQTPRHTVLELDKHWWICGSKIENADSLMECYDCKRGRDQRLVPSPVAAQGNAGEDCIPWESDMVNQFSIWIWSHSISYFFPVLCCFFSICFGNVEISGLYQVRPSGKFRQSIGPKEFLAVRSHLSPMLKIYLFMTSYYNTLLHIVLIILYVYNG